MQKWEYIRVWVRYKSTYNAIAQEAYSNGISITSGKSLIDMNDYIKQLGKEGWELAHAREDDSSAWEVLYFKRPIE